MACLWGSRGTSGLSTLGGGQLYNIFTLSLTVMCTECEMGWWWGGNFWL